MVCWLLSAGETGGRERVGNNRNNRSHKFSCATAWRGIIMLLRAAIEWVAKAFEFVVFPFISFLFHPTTLSHPVRHSQPNKIPAFLKVIKFYDFFMCLPLLGLTLAYDMLFLRSSLFHRLTFLFRRHVRISSTDLADEKTRESLPFAIRGCRAGPQHGIRGAV